MAQFDAYRYRGTFGARYVVDLQHDLLRDLATRLVAPAYPVDEHARPINRLNPIIEINGIKHYLAVQEAAAIRASRLGERKQSLKGNRDAIVAAIDLLVTGI